MVDTLTIARELRAADLPAPQAEAIAAAIARSITESAATKADVAAAEQSLRSEINLLKAELQMVRQEFQSIASTHNWTMLLEQQSSTVLPRQQSTRSVPLNNLVCR